MCLWKDLQHTKTGSKCLFYEVFLKRWKLSSVGGKLRMIYSIGIPCSSILAHFWPFLVLWDKLKMSWTDWWLDGIGQNTFSQAELNLFLGVLRKRPGGLTWRAESQMSPHEWYPAQLLMPPECRQPSRGSMCTPTVQYTRPRHTNPPVTIMLLHGACYASAVLCSVLWQNAGENFLNICPGGLDDGCLMLVSHETSGIE